VGSRTRRCWKQTNHLKGHGHLDAIVGLFYECTVYGENKMPETDHFASHQMQLPVSTRYLPSMIDVWMEWRTGSLLHALANVLHSGINPSESNVRGFLFLSSHQDSDHHASACCSSKRASIRRCRHHSGSGLRRDTDTRLSACVQPAALRTEIPWGTTKCSSRTRTPLLPHT
jgi:hypothetical protein